MEGKEPPITDDELIILRHFIKVHRLMVGPNKKIVHIADPTLESAKQKYDRKPFLIKLFTPKPY